MIGIGSLRGKNSKEFFKMYFPKTDLKVKPTLLAFYIICGRMGDAVWSMDMRRGLKG